VRPVSPQSTTRTAHRRQRGTKWTLAGVVVTLSLWAIRAYAQTGAPLTIDPAMTKGRATAPVTIVEFSDYQ
jgi:hypothetical protein